MKKTQNSRLFVVVIVAFLVTITLLAATGCEKVQLNNNAPDENKNYLVGEEYLKGYGKDHAVYVQTKNGKLYTAASATDISVFEKNGVGFDGRPYGYEATGIYVQLESYGQATASLLSYGDISPVVLKRDAGDVLYSIKNDDHLTFFPVTFDGRNSYKEAMEKYQVDLEEGDIRAELQDVQACRCYKISGKAIEVGGIATDSGTMYDISNLEAGLYYIEDVYGILEIR